jgi:hypothetical protein
MGAALLACCPFPRLEEGGVYTDVYQLYPLPHASVPSMQCVLVSSLLSGQMWTVTLPQVWAAARLGTAASYMCTPMTSRELQEPCLEFLRGPPCMWPLSPVGEQEEGLET